MAAHLPTPIPVGSPHLNEPPVFDRWGLGYAKQRRLDKRDYERRPVARDLWLIDHQANAVLRCRSNDISDAGMHATAPIGFGMAVGQRYEIKIANGDHGAFPHAGATKSLGYGTVIRTEMQIGRGPLDRVGFALRFDVPQLIEI
jgi:hypothetical protein